jgi:hypothetical protein
VKRMSYELLLAVPGKGLGFLLFNLHDSEADEAQIRTCHIVSIRRIWSRSRSRGSVLLRGAQIEVSETSSTSRA